MIHTSPARRRPRALLVSWLFPPHASIGAKRAYRFARYLPAQGWDVTVLCGREPPAHSIDPTPLSLPPGVRVVLDYDPAWLTMLANRIDARARGALARVPDAASSTHGTVSTEREFSHARALRRSFAARASARFGALLHDALPTETVAVHLPHALSSALRLAREERPALVWTTSYPYSAHLIGVALKRRLGLPFVADLRDPWTLNFVHDGKLAPARWAERRLEALVFAHADRVTLTTESLAAAYREIYPAHAHKFVAIRNGFDPLALPPRVRSTRPVRLVHFGHVYAARTMACVYEALAALRARGAFAQGELLLENYGRLSDQDRARVDALGLADVVRVMDPVPYAEGLERLRSASLLLLPAWGTDRGALFLPGKLYDYLLAGVPVLALGENPELAAILAHTRAGTLAAPSDSTAIEATIAAALGPEPPFSPDPDAVAEYSAPRAAARLAALFDELVGRSRPTASAHALEMPFADA